MSRNGKRTKQTVRTTRAAQRAALRQQDREMAASLMLDIAKLIAPNEGIKEQIARIARLYDWEPTRVREIWYGNARRIEGWEIRMLWRIQSKKTKPRKLS